MIAGSLEIQLMASVARLQRDMDQARQVVTRATDGMARAANAAKVALAGIGVGLGGQQLTAMVDGYINLTGQLKNATTSHRELTQAMSDVQRIAKVAQADIRGIGTSYARLTNNLRDLGTSQSAVADITETVSLALKVNGATVEESTSAMLQLSQAFGKGKLDGDEFRTLMEASPNVMRRVAEGMRVPFGALKDLAKQGEITGEVLARVLSDKNYLGVLREQAKEMQTIGGALIVLKNNFMEFVGTQSKASGVVSTLTGAIGTLAENLGLVAKAVLIITGARLVGWLDVVITKTMEKVAANRALVASNLAVAQADATASAQASLLANARLSEVRAATLASAGNVQLALTTNGLIPAQLRASATAAAHEVNMNRLTIAQRAASLSAAALAAGTRALNGVLAFTGGPLGLLITVLGAAALAWSHYGNKAKEANDKAKLETEKSTQEIIDDLNKQNDKLRERIELAKQAGMQDAAQQGGEAAERQASLLKQILDLQYNINAGTAGPNASLHLIDLQYKYTDLANAMERVAGSQNVLASRTRDERLADWYAQNGTSAQKLAAELEKLKKEFGELPPEMEKMVRAKYADKGAAAAINQERTAYQSLVASIRAKIDENRLELKIGENASESQKALIKLDQELAAGKLKLTAAHEATVRAALAEQAATEDLLKAQKAQQDITKFIVESTRASEDASAALTVEYAMYGKTTDAREIAMVAVKAEADMQKKLGDLREKNLPISDQIIAQLKAERDARVRVEQATMGQGKALAYAARLAEENKRFAAEAIADPRARARAVLQIDADIWQERIKLAGEGTEAQKALQSEYATWYANQSKTVLTGADITRAKELLDIMSAINDAARDAAAGMAASFGKVGSAIGGLTTAMTEYGRTQAAIAAQLAAATKDANGDQSKIHKANAAAALQSAQAQLKSYGDLAAATKGFFKEKSAGYRAMEGVEKSYRAFEMALAVKTMLEKSGLLTAFTSQVVASKATETAATVASVGPDVAASMAKGQAAATAGVAGQAQGDPYSAWARMAAMAAVMAALGFAVSGRGSGGGQTAAQVQKAQGTGGVFGDAEAKSASITKAIELTAKNSNIELSHTAGMLASLKNIEAAMTGLTNLVVRSTGVTDGSNMGIFTGQLNAKGSAVDDISRWATRDTKILFGPGIGDKIASFINNLWGKVTQKIIDSGLMFGGRVSDLQAGLGYSQYASIDTTRSTWFGLSKKTTNSVQTQGLNDELSSQFALIFTNLEESLKVAATNLGIRTNQVSIALDALVIESTKVSLKDLKGEELQAALNAVISKTMDQMAEAAFPAFDQFRKVGEGYAETVMRVTANYVNLDSILRSIGSTFGAIGIESLAARERLIDLAGGIDELAGKTSFFAENFLTEAERLAPVQAYVTEQLAAMGLAGITSRDEFKAVALAIDKTTEAGARQFVAMMDLAEAFAKVYPEAEAATDALKRQAEAFQAMKDAASVLLGAVDSAFSVLQSVVGRQIDLIQKRIDKERALSNAIRSTLDGMRVQGAEMADRAAAQAQISAALAISKAGGPLPDAESLRKALSVVSQDAAAQFSTREDYLRDFYRTQNEIAQLGDLADAALSVDEQQLASLNGMLDSARQQIDLLKGIDTSALSIAQAMAGLQLAIAAAQANPVVSATSEISKAYQSALGRAPDAAGLEFWQNHAAQGTPISTITDAIKNSAEAKVQELYQSVFGRAADAGGLQFWVQHMSNGTSLDTVRDAFMQSEEYKKLRSFDVGTNRVPYDMVAKIHEDERIIPAADNRELMRRLASPSENSVALAAAVERLTATVERQQQALDQIQRNTKKQADDFERVTRGGDAMVTKTDPTTESA